MANIKSQIKRNRQNEKRRLRNKSTKSEIRTRAKAVHQAIEEGDLDKAEEALRSAQKQLDRAAAARLLHPNTVARRKSQLARTLEEARRG